MATLQELEQLKQRLNNAKEKNSYLYFILKESKAAPAPFSVYKTVNAPEISNAFISFFEYNLDEILQNQVNLVSYDINLDTTEAYQYIPAANVTHAQIINQPIFNDAATPIFENMDEQAIKKIWAYAVKVTIDQEDVIYYRKYSPGKILRPGSFNAIVYHGGRFSRMEDNIFQISDDMDAFFFNDEIMITKTLNFERIFGYEEMYEVAAQTALEQIAAVHTYVDIAQLNVFIGTDGRKKRKLSAILNNRLIKQMGYNEICKTIQDYNLDIQIDRTNQQFTLTAQNALIFLKALNDDYLRSERTTNRYEISSKRRT
jgi:hypothetical protein